MSLEDNRRLGDVSNSPALPENFRDVVDLNEHNQPRRYEAKTAPNPRYDRTPHSTLSRLRKA